MDPEKAVADMNTSIQEFLATQKDLETTLKASADASETDAKAAVNVANELAEKISGISSQILEIEQNMTENVMQGKAKVETLGKMVIESDAFKQFAAGGNNKMKFQANTIIGQEGSPLENADTIVAPQRLPGIIPGAVRMLRVSDILPQGTTTSNMLEYTRELLFTNAAAETNEGGAKPESTLTFELATAPVKTIAHFIKASKQVLDDSSALMSYIDTRLRYGVELRIDNQLLTGNGTNPNISGILDTGNNTVFTPVSGDNQLDSINKMIEAVHVAEYAPTAIILNPADWFAISRLKVGAADDRYVIGNPASALGPVLWGLPVVVTNAMTAGSAVVAAFDIAYQQWNRSGVVVEMFEQDDTNVQQNLLTIRAEARKALAIYRPASAQAGALVL